MLTKGLSKGTLPVQENALITKRSIFVTDLTLDREFFFPEGEKIFSDSTESMLINLTSLKNISENKDYSNILFESINETQFKVIGNGEVFSSITSEKVEEYPVATERIYPIDLQVNGYLLELAHDMLFAIDKKTITPKFECVSVNNGIMFATDAQRLPFHKVSPLDFCTYENYTDERIKSINFLINYRIINALPKSTESPIHVLISDPDEDKRYVKMIIDGITYGFRMPIDDPAKVKSVIPQGNLFSMVMYEPSITANLKMAISMNPHAVDLSWSDENPEYLFFRSDNLDTNEFFSFKSKLIKIPKGIKRFKFQYNPSYLMQMIGFEKSKYIDVHFSHQRCAIMLFKHGLLMNKYISEEVCEVIKPIEEPKEIEPDKGKEEPNGTEKQNAPDQPIEDRGAEQKEHSGIEPNYNFENERE